MKELIKKFKEVVKKNHLEDLSVEVSARTLLPEEAIGNPQKRDYPILKGKERMIEAVFRNGKGHAFTDMPGNYKGKISEILSFAQKNNFECAVFMAVMNAVLNDLKLIEKTVHCKDKEPAECGKKLLEKAGDLFTPGSKILMVGYQPRLAESMNQLFDLRIVDMDPDNYLSEKNIESPEKTEEYLKWCDGIFATGSCFANDTWNLFADSGKPLVFYGVTCAAPCELLDYPRYCELGS